MQLHHRAYGEGSPLIILHGLLGDSGNWHTLSRRYFARHHRVYALDQRNHGRSPHVDVHDYPSMVADLEGFLDAEDLDAVNLMGHSMGGMTAMHFAVAHPDRVERLVVIDIAPKAYPPEHREVIDTMRGLDLSSYDSREEIDEALAESVEAAAVRQFLLKNVALDSDTGAYRWQVNLDVLHRDSDRLVNGLETKGRFDGPVLFVRGSRSDYVLDEDHWTILDHFPSAEVVTIEGAGHWVHADAPEELSESVLSFLNN